MVNNQVIELAVLKVKKLTFKNDKGELINYNNYYVTIADKNFSLFPNKESKQLFNYLVGQEIEKIEEGI